MTDDPRGTRNITIGTPVVAFDGSLLGNILEVHPHYLLVGESGQHTDLEVPVHSILALADGKLRVSVNRRAVPEVDSMIRRQPTDFRRRARNAPGPHQPGRP